MDPGSVAGHAIWSNRTVIPYFIVSPEEEREPGFEILCLQITDSWMISKVLVKKTVTRYLISHVLLIFQMTTPCLAWFAGPVLFG